MCGIFGISYGPAGPDGEEWAPEELLQIMFPAIVHRGPHAWGWMSWDGDDIEIYKQVGRSDTMTAIRNMNPQPNSKWIVGHVRYATHGNPDHMINNHPVRHDNIIGVHNGVLRNHQSILDKTGRHDPKCELDSEAIFAAVNKWGHASGLRKIEGAMVTVYTDVRHPDTLRIARSAGRPLVIARTPAGSIIFASEPEVIEATGIKSTAPSSVLSNRLLTVREGKIVGRKTYKETSKTALPDALGNRKPFKVGKPHRFVDESSQKPAKKKARRQRVLHAGHPAEKEFAKKASKVSSSQMLEGEKYGDMYYYQGVFMTKDEFDSAILAERG